MVTAAFPVDVQVPEWQDLGALVLNIPYWRVHCSIDRYLNITAKIDGKLLKFTSREQRTGCFCQHNPAGTLG